MKTKFCRKGLNLLLCVALLLSMLPKVPIKAEGEGDGGIQEVNIEVTSYSVTPETVTAGNNFKLSFTIKKDGAQNIKEGSVYVTFNTPEGISYTGSNKKMKLVNFSNSQASTYEAEFETSGDITSGKKNIDLVFSYIYTDGVLSLPGTNEGMARVNIQSAKAPKLSISGNGLSVARNTDGKVELNFKNESSSTEITNLSVDYTASEGLSLNTSQENISSITAGTTVKKSVSLSAGKDAGQKQTITCTYSYDYKAGSQTITVTGEKTINVSVTGSTVLTAKPYLILESYDYGGVKNYNTAFTLQTKFKNSSSKIDLQNVVITMEPAEGLILTDSSNKVMISKLQAGSSSSKSVHLRVANDASTGYKALNFKISYEYIEDGEVKEGETEAVANISVKGKKEKTNVGSATPYLMISSYDYGDKVAAGSEFNLHMDVKNTSTSQKVENIVVSMAMPEDLTIASSSNTFYIDSLSAGDVYNYDIRLAALPSAKAMSSAITLSFVYEYMDNHERKQVTSEEQISIPVYQPDRLSAELSAQESEMYAGSEGTISVAYVNKGKGTLYNVEAVIHTKSDVDIIETKQNLGNFDPGANGAIEFYVTPYEEGCVEGKITINYEDENMEVKSVKIPFSYDVYAMDDMGGDEYYYDEEFYDDEYMDEGMAEENKSKKNMLKIGLIIFAVIVVIIVIIVVIKKIRKRRKLKLQQLEDMMDEEDE